MFMGCCQCADQTAAAVEPTIASVTDVTNESEAVAVTLLTSKNHAEMKEPFPKAERVHSAEESDVEARPNATKEQVHESGQQAKTEERSQKVDINECKEAAGAETENSSARVDAQLEPFWLEHEVHLVRGCEGQKLGFHVELDCKDQMSVSLNSAMEDAVGAWNDANPDRALRRADIILDVNDCGGNGLELLEELKRGSEVRMRVRRLLKVDVVVQRFGRLGLQCALQNGLVVVEAISDGDVKKSNSTCLAGRQVSPGEIVDMVNGLAQSPVELLDTLAKLDESKELLMLSIKRTN